MTTSRVRPASRPAGRAGRSSIRPGAPPGAAAARDPRHYLGTPLGSGVGQRRRPRGVDDVQHGLARAPGSAAASGSAAPGGRVEMTSSARQPGRRRRTARRSSIGTPSARRRSRRVRAVRAGSRTSTGSAARPSRGERDQCRLGGAARAEHGHGRWGDARARRARRGFRRRRCCRRASRRGRRGAGCLPRRAARATGDACPPRRSAPLERHGAGEPGPVGPRGEHVGELVLAAVDRVVASSPGPSAAYAARCRTGEREWAIGRPERPPRPGRASATAPVVRLALLGRPAANAASSLVKNRCPAASELT